MKQAKVYENVVSRFYRPEIHKCLDCQHTIKRAVTLSQRTVVTLREIIKVTHGGYRCTNPQCKGTSRTYRSAAADALALPGFTFGLDIVLLAGQLHLGQHKTPRRASIKNSCSASPQGRQRFRAGKYLICLMHFLLCYEQHPMQLKMKSGRQK